MDGITEQELAPYLEVMKRFLLGKKHASVELTMRNGRINITGSNDVVLAQNGKILEPIGQDH